MTDAIERAARVIAEADFPDLWSGNPKVAHNAASPFAVSAVREDSLNKGRLLAQALSDAGMLDQGWRGIGEAESYQRMIVCGWAPRQRNVAGYWWMHEDVADEFGVPIDHPTATLFQPLPTPPAEGEG